MTCHMRQALVDAGLPLTPIRMSDHLLTRPRFAVNSWDRVLTADEVRAIRHRYLVRQERASVLAGDFGVHVRTIYRITTGENWGHVV